MSVQYDDVTVRQFMNAWFKDDRSVMTEEEFLIVRSQYVDAAGLYSAEEFEKVCYIYFLNNRKNTVKLWLQLQIAFLEEFEIPNIDEFEILKQYGYFVTWKENKMSFVDQLVQIEDSEKKYEDQLDNALKELDDLRKIKAQKSETEEITIDKSRKSFVRMLVSLGKIGYRIDNDKTTVEELSLMIKQQTEENEAILSQSNK